MDRSKLYRRFRTLLIANRDDDAAFERAVVEVAAVSRRLLAGLVTSAGPKDRAEAAARARERSRARFGRS